MLCLRIPDLISSLLEVNTPFECPRICWPYLVIRWHRWHTSCIPTCRKSWLDSAASWSWSLVSCLQGYSRTGLWSADFYTGMMMSGKHASLGSGKSHKNTRRLEFLQRSHRLASIIDLWSIRGLKCWVDVAPTVSWIFCSAGICKPCTEILWSTQEDRRVNGIDMRILAGTKVWDGITYYQS